MISCLSTKECRRGLQSCRVCRKEGRENNVYCDLVSSLELAVASPACVWMSSCRERRESDEGGRSGLTPPHGNRVSANSG